MLQNCLLGGNIESDLGLIVEYTCIHVPNMLQGHYLLPTDKWLSSIKFCEMTTHFTCTTSASIKHSTNTRTCPCPLLYPPYPAQIVHSSNTTPIHSIQPPLPSTPSPLIPPIPFSTNSLLPNPFPLLIPIVELHSHIGNHGWYWITVAKNVALSWSSSYVLNEIYSRVVAVFGDSPKAGCDVVLMAHLWHFAECDQT